MHSTTPEAGTPVPATPEPLAPATPNALATASVIDGGTREPQVVDPSSSLSPRRSGRRAAAVAFDGVEAETAAAFVVAGPVRSGRRAAASVPDVVVSGVGVGTDDVVTGAGSTAESSLRPRSGRRAAVTSDAVASAGPADASALAGSFVVGSSAAALSGVASSATASSAAASSATAPSSASSLSTASRTASSARRSTPAAQRSTAPSRRVMRHADRPITVAGSAVPPVVATNATGSGFVAKSAKRVVMLAVVGGILATSILPILSQKGGDAFAAGTGTTYKVVGGQKMKVAGDVTNASTSRDTYGATSLVDMQAQTIANRQAAKVTTYTGPTAADYVANPLYPIFDRTQIFDVALQYLGTPYVHGGADPSAFDCSGFIMFVYAQFGVSLAHYVPTQDKAGVTIPESEAVPGDLVVFDNEEHDGFYAGNGNILDAPKPGGYISVRPIWDQPHHFVRINP